MKKGGVSGRILFSLSIRWLSVLTVLAISVVLSAFTDSPALTPELPVTLAATQTPGPTPAPTSGSTLTPTATPIATQTPGPTPVPTWESTLTPTATPTATQTPGPTPVPTWESTLTPTATPTATQTPGPTPVPTSESTLTPTAIPTATQTPGPTPVPTAESTLTPTATPTSTPSPVPTAALTATLTHTATPTPAPTATPTPTPTPLPPDFTVDLPTTSDSNPITVQSLTLGVTVRNQGNGPSEPTTLRYYRSTDSVVTTEDAEVGIVQVDALDASASSAASVRTTAPPTPGTYYYSACVEPVSRESDMTNNCSEAVAVAVLPPPPDLVVDAPRVSDSSPMAGQFFTLSSTVRNRGPGISGYTTLSYYRSSDSTVTLADTEVGANRVSGLIASGSSAESALTHAPPSSGTNYYGVCVGGVSGESDTTNNCSDAVAVTVSQYHIDNLPWVADGITGDERRAMGQIRFLARIDPPMSQRVAGSLWLADGISEGDLLGISQLLDLARSRPQAAALVTTIPDQTGELMQDAMNSLQHLNRSSNTARLDQVLSQSWFQDGLTQEEAALIVVLISAADTDDVFQDLLEDGHVKSETISLPLAGDVDLFAVGRSEYGLQKTLDGTAFAVEALEGFMVNRIPKSNVIVLVETRHDLGLSATGGWNTGTHVVTKTKWSDTLYHEIAHLFRCKRWRPDS